MGCCFRKHTDAGTQGQVGESTAQDAAAKEEEGSGLNAEMTPESPDEVYLPNPESPGNVVDFGIKLQVIDGEFALNDIVENGLAQAAGIENGDVLVDINGANIEACSAQYILDILRTKVKPKLLLAVKRTSDDGKVVFVWSFFEVVIQGNHPAVNVIQLTKTEENVMPWIDIKQSAVSGFDWLGPPVLQCDLFINEDNEQLYLSIVDSVVEFVATYNKSQSAFYRYVYAGSGEPGNGTVIVYSLQEPEKPVAPSTTLAAEATKSDPKLGVTDFPESMLRDGVPLDPRFWYEQLQGDEVTLQSVQQSGWYLSKSSSSNVADLSQKSMEMTRVYAN
ncbi:uncharacterized protein LOC110983422 [Acanthaster planci]|uniref:Uncharacterized protein LOC110983422 n=1 Tax=Acanthaster planci TaxID=133434 RepID=A0A8B7Z0Q7_ACAPL|nr:uncharacterized protein LOC110983422 [Acanthaster planci]XP_022098365.1 uncharacterized protein LOC110983422 [Acanthaster planci]